MADCCAMRRVAFSPDGGRMLSGSLDKTIKLWDAATGALVRTFEGHLGGLVGGILARWQPYVVGQRRHDDQVVGRSDGDADPHFRGALWCGRFGGVLAQWRARSVG